MIKGLWSLSFKELDKNEVSELDIMHLKIIFQLSFLVSFLLGLNSFVWLLSGNILNFCILFIMGNIIFILPYRKKLYSNSFIIFIIYILLSIIIFFFSIGDEFDNGLAFYYFPLLISSAIVLPKNNKKHYLEIVIYIMVFIFYIISQYFNFKFVDNESSDSFLTKENIRTIAFIQVYILIAFISYLITNKQKRIIKLYQHINRDKKIIHDLKKKHTTSVQAKIDIENLVYLAQENSPSFIASFQQAFPYFYENLLSINPNTTNEEFKFCALLKLGFTTKDIAMYNDLTVRTIQTKKSRLRKSFNIPSRIDLYAWIEKI